MIDPDVIQVFDGSGVDPHLHVSVFCNTFMASSQQGRGYQELRMVYLTQSEMQTAFKQLQENPEIALLTITDDLGNGYEIHHVKRVWVEDFSQPWRLIYQFTSGGAFPFKPLHHKGNR